VHSVKTPAFPAGETFPFPDGLERIDRWLLSLSGWQLRHLALLLGLILNVPTAWASFRLPFDPRTDFRPEYRLGRTRRFGMNLGDAAAMVSESNAKKLLS